jgi:rubrerythrin
LLSAAAAASQQKERQQKMILSPASTKWRGAYYACRICKHYADFIAPRGLTPICTDCKARYVGIFGYEAFESMREERREEK